MKRAIYESVHDVVLCSEIRNRVHSKKILLQRPSTYVEILVTAILSRVKRASALLLRLVKDATGSTTIRMGVIQY